MSNNSSEIKVGDHVETIDGDVGRVTSIYIDNDDDKAEIARIELMNKDGSWTGERVDYVTYSLKKIKSRPNGIQILTDGTSRVVVPANGQRFTAKELQQLVGGYYEPVLMHRTGQYFVLDEDAYLKQLPANRMATVLFQLAQPSLIPAVTLYGNVFLVDGDFMPLDEEPEEPTKTIEVVVCVAAENSGVRGTWYTTTLEVPDDVNVATLDAPTLYEHLFADKGVDAPDAPYIFVI